LLSLDQIQITELPRQIAGAKACLKIGGRWLHLRMCLDCGKTAAAIIAERHASKHARADEHPIVRSAEPVRTGVSFVERARFRPRVSGRRSLQRWNLTKENLHRYPDRRKVRMSLVPFRNQLWHVTL